MKPNATQIPRLTIQLKTLRSFGLALSNACLNQFISMVKVRKFYDDLIQFIVIFRHFLCWHTNLLEEAVYRDAANSSAIHHTHTQIR